jgi:hypothetical protein
MSGADVESIGGVPAGVSVDTALSKPFELERLFFVVESALSAEGEREERG